MLRSIHRLFASPAMRMNEAIKHGESVINFSSIDQAVKRDLDNAGDRLHVQVTA